MSFWSITEYFIYLLYLLLSKLLSIGSCWLYSHHSSSILHSACNKENWFWVMLSLQKSVLKLSLQLKCQFTSLKI